MSIEYQGGKLYRVTKKADEAETTRAAGFPPEGRGRAFVAVGIGDNFSAYISPAQARELAARLVAAADVADGKQEAA